MIRSLVQTGVFVASALALSCAQAGAIYDFSYTFDNGTIISGSFSGVADGNIVHIEDDNNMTVSANVPILQGSDFFTAHFTYPQLVWVKGGAVASFDGTQNNFSIRYIDTSAYHFQRDAFWSISQASDSTTWQMAGGTEFTTSDFALKTNMGTKWVLTQQDTSAKVPEPSSLALMALGVVSACALKRRRKD